MKSNYIEKFLKLFVNKNTLYLWQVQDNLIPVKIELERLQNRYKPITEYMRGRLDAYKCLEKYINKFLNMKTIDNITFYVIAEQYSKNSLKCFSHLSTPMSEYEEGYTEAWDTKVFKQYSDAVYFNRK